MQFGALGVLALLLFYLLKYAAPKIMEHMDKKDDKFLAALEQLTNKYSTDLKEIQQINIESHRRSQDLLREQNNVVVAAVADNTKAMNAIQLELAKGTNCSNFKANS